ncbi:hypothetical protein ACLOJK_001542 [Asimina triloba]
MITLLIFFIDIVEWSFVIWKSSVQRFKVRFTVFFFDFSSFVKSRRPIPSMFLIRAKRKAAWFGRHSLLLRAADCLPFPIHCFSVEVLKKIPTVCLRSDNPHRSIAESRSLISIGWSGFADPHNPHRSIVELRGFISIGWSGFGMRTPTYVVFSPFGEAQETYCGSKIDCSRFLQSTHKRLSCAVENRSVKPIVVVFLPDRAHERLWKMREIRRARENCLEKMRGERGDRTDGGRTERLRAKHINGFHGAVGPPQVKNNKYADTKRKERDGRPRYLSLRKTGSSGIWSLGSLLTAYYLWGPPSLPLRESQISGIFSRKLADQGMTGIWVPASTCQEVFVPPERDGNQAYTWPGLAKYLVSLFLNSGNGSVEVPQRTSPATPRTGRQIKVTGSESDSGSSTQPASRSSTERSPKVLERRSPRSPATEKKRPSRISELESQLSHLQEELQKAKLQLVSSESRRVQAEQEAADAKQQLLAMAAKCEESQNQLLELSEAEESRLQELRKISQERDRAWESELEALQKQHSVDSAALSSAMNEIQRLKRQLEAVAESEAAQANQADTAYAEIESLKLEMSETLALIEILKSELRDYKESEGQAQAMVSETSLQLETAKTTIAMLRSEGYKAMESFNSAIVELEDSRATVNSLEESIKELQADLVKVNDGKLDDSQGVNEFSSAGGEPDDRLKLINELNASRSEVDQLKSSLEAAEMRHQVEQIQNTMQIQSAYELVERSKESNLREAELEAEVKKTQSEIVELKANLMDKENELQNILAENEGLNSEIEKSRSNSRERLLEIEVKKAEVDIAELKANLMDKETELQSISEENELLKAEIEKRDLERGKGNVEAMTEAEAARAAEREALTKLGYVTEEADKSSRRAARVTEQLEAVQAANAEMEAELRRLRVQTDQWRKAAEAAAAVISTNSGKLMERSGSMDGEYHGKMPYSPYEDDLDDDDLLKKKNNVLKKIGVLWKKGGNK